MHRKNKSKILKWKKDDINFILKDIKIEFINMSQTSLQIYE